MYLAPETNVETLSVETLTQGVREKLARFRLADDDDAVTSVTTDAYLKIREFNGVGEFRAFVFRVLDWKTKEFIRNRKRRQDKVGFLPEEFDGADVKSEPKEGFDLNEIAEHLTPTEQMLVSALIAGKNFAEIEQECGYTHRSATEIFSRIRRKFAA
jgi:DNA-directed RNA polymerase specialized sigma24 family protein